MISLSSVDDPLLAFHNLLREKKRSRNMTTLRFALLLTLPTVVFLESAREFNIYFPHQSENSSLSSFIHYNMFPDFTKNLASLLQYRRRKIKNLKKIVFLAESWLDKISELFLTVPPSTLRQLSAPAMSADQLRKLSNFSCLPTSPTLR